MALKIIHTKNLRWIDIINPTTDEISYLKNEYDFHPLDYEDVMETSQHSKIEKREDYIFIVLLFPVYKRNAAEITPTEVNFFIGKNYLITIHDGSMYTMTGAVNAAANDAEMRAAWMGKNPGVLLYHILESLLRRSFPILDHISKDMDEVEKNIFHDLGIKMLRRIAQMKRNIIDVRRIMKTHYLILRKLMNAKETYISFPDSKEYYTNLTEHVENIWDILAIQKETIESLQDANQSLATNVLNQITKTDTIISGIFFPATLIIFLFSLDMLGKPFENNHYGFWIVFAIAALASAVMIFFFRRKRWM